MRCLGRGFLRPFFTWRNGHNAGRLPVTRRAPRIGGGYVKKTSCTPANQFLSRRPQVAHQAVGALLESASGKRPAGTRMWQILCNNSPTTSCTRHSRLCSYGDTSSRRLPPDDLTQRAADCSGERPLEPLCRHCGRLYRDGIELRRSSLACAQSRGLTTMIDRAYSSSNTAGIAVE
jgi:hypothetical protein